MGKAYADKVKSRSGGGKRASTPRRGSGKGSKKEERPPFPLAPFVVMGIILVLIVAGVVMYAIDQNGGESGTTTEGNDDNGGGSGPQSSGDGPGSILLDSVDGGQIFLDQYRGKVVVIDMFATWCGPCRTQMGELSDLSSRFSPSDLVILSVDADLSENMDQVRELRTQMGASWTFAMSNSDFNSAFPASSIPTMFILDREGNVVEKHVGVTSADILESEIDSHL